jgi:hypothetical protein
MMEPLMIDVEKALLDHGLVFKTPDEVVNSDELSRELKIKILRRWEYDVRELEVAEEEGMKGPKLVTLDAVLGAYDRSTRPRIASDLHLLSKVVADTR